MADRYLITGGGAVNWNSTGSWAATDGGATGASFPVAGDRVFMTALSGAGTLTINVVSACGDIDCTGFTGTLAGANGLSCNGSIIFVAGMGLTMTGTLTLNATAGTKTLTTGTKQLQGNLTINGSGGTFQLGDNLSTKGGLILTAGSFSVNGKSVTFNGSATISGAFTFADLILLQTAGSHGRFTFNANITITGTLTITGQNVADRIVVQSNTFGTPRTLSAAAVTLSDVIFIDIAATGAAGLFTGTRLGDAGGNSGITFTGAVNRFWVGNTGNWGAAAVWATTSGGAGGTNYPLPQDTAVFDANSFLAGAQVCTVTPTSAQFMKVCNIDCSAINRASGLNFGLGTTNAYTGDIKLNSTMTVAGTINFEGKRATQTITTGGADFPAFNMNGGNNGTVKLGDDWTSTSTVSTSGAGNVFDLNGHTLTTTIMTCASGTLTSTAAGGKLVVNSTAAGTSFSGGATITNTANWTIDVAGNTANIRTFAGAGKTYPAISFKNTTANGELDFTGSNTFDSISVTNPPQSIKFTAATTTTIKNTNGFPTGTAGNLVTIDSITAAAHNLALTGGGISTVISRDFLTITNSHALPAGAWGAGHNSVDNGGNTGWVFADAFLGIGSEAGVAAETNDVIFVFGADGSETAAAADTPSALTSYFISEDEAGAALDTPSGALVTSVSTAEAGASVDTQSGAKSTDSSISEAGVAAEVESALTSAVGLAAEAGVAAEVESALTSAVGLAAEAGVAAASPSAIISFTASLVEAGAALDTPSGALVTSVSTAEAGASVDTQSGAKSVDVTTPETGAALEVESALTSAAAQAAELGAALDASVAISSFFADQQEAGNAQDSSLAPFDRYPVRVYIDFNHPAP